MWVKICGITRPEDAVAAVEAGADALGLNFFSGSKRCVTVKTAQQIARAIRCCAVPESWSRLPACHPEAEQRQAESLPHSVDLVGVFVNAAPDEILRISSAIPLTAVQFHGDELAADIAKVHAGSPDLHLIRALRISSGRRQSCFDHFQDLQNHVPLFAALLDAFVPGEFGGTGFTLDRQLIADYRTQNVSRLILAGGLTPENVAETIATCQPWGIDTASGVESSPGIKCADKMRRFVSEARLASQANR